MNVMREWRRSPASGPMGSQLKQRGWGASEYLSVLLGLMVVWWGAQRVLALVQEHHDEFTWALMMPF
jgi:hypothetical protein